MSMLIKFVDMKMKIYLILNDQPLGIAYDVPENTLDGIFPVVKFSGKGSVEIQEGNSTNAPLEPLKPLSIEGNWTLNTLTGKTFSTKVTMKISEIYDRVHEKSYRLRIHIINKFIGTLRKISTSTWSGEILDQTVFNGTVNEMQLETQISKHISGVKNVVFDGENAELKLESMGTTSVWKQIEPKLTFVNWNPFKK